MKKIILTALTVLMMFGLIGCSGDLHDYKDPEMFTGTWYYYDVPTDAANVIFNIADGNQSSNIEGIDVSTGSIYYAWDSTLTQNDVGNNKVYEPGDKPDSKAGRVWVYTNAKAAPNCYWWGCANKDDNPGWPGKTMSKAGEEPVVEPVYTITMVVDGFTPGQKVVVNGEPYVWTEWPFVGWLGWEAGDQDVEKAEKLAKEWIDSYATTQVFTADDSGIIVVTFTVKKLPGTKVKVQFVTATVAEGVYTSGDQTGKGDEHITIELPEEPGAYTARITFAKEATTPAVVY